MGLHLDRMTQFPAQFAQKSTRIDGTGTMPSSIRRDESQKNRLLERMVSGSTSGISLARIAHDCGPAIAKTPQRVVTF